MNRGGAVDVVIVGGGPAGATVGRLLAQWGCAVTIVARESRQPALAETLPPSINRLFNLLEIRKEIESAGFYRTTGNTSWWGSEQARVERYGGASEEAGYQVVRNEFDGVLLDMAARAGAEICRDTVARVELRETALVHLRSGREVQAKFVLDCSGRTGVLARPDLRLMEPGYGTLAIGGVWSGTEPWPGADQTHTLIESYPDGWAWSVPVSPTHRFVTTMINLRETRVLRGSGLQSTYLTELSKTRAFRPMLEASQLQGTPWACDASLYHASLYAGPRFLLIGDAGSSVDPLSSFGVKKAMASAWLGAVVVNTCLNRPGMASAALDHFEDREHQVYAGHLRQTAALFKEVAAKHPQPFWTSRSEPPQEAEFYTEAELGAALDALQRSPAIRLRRDGQVSFASVPRVRGREIVLEETLVATCLPRGLEYIRGVHIPKLVEFSGQFGQVPELFEAYNRASVPVDLPNFLAALSVLLAKRVLHNDVSI